VLRFGVPIDSADRLRHVVISKTTFSEWRFESFPPVVQKLLERAKCVSIELALDAYMRSDCLDTTS